MTWDQIGFRLIQSMTGNPFVDRFMVQIAEILVLMVPAVLVYLWFDGREGKHDSLLTFYSVILGLLTSYGMGLIYFHENPSAVFDTIVAYKSENAFPSQHTTALFSAAWPLLWRERKRFGYIMAVMALLTGFARVYIGEHWPIDILGALVASAIGFIILYISKAKLNPLTELLIGFYQSIEEMFLEKLR